MECERHNRLNPQSEKSAYVSDCFGDDIPTIAVSDYIAAVPEMIQRWVGGRFTVLGTDGFGRSDTREELRRFFEIDTKSIILAPYQLLRRGDAEEGTVKEESDKMGISGIREDKALVMGRFRRAVKLATWIWKNKIILATLGSVISRFRRK